MQAPRHFESALHLRGVGVVEFRAPGHEPRDLPTLPRVLVDVRFVEAQVGRGLEGERLGLAVDDVVGARARMTVDVALPAAREVEREVGQALLEGAHVDDVAAQAAQRRADVVEHARTHVVDEFRVEALQLVERVELVDDVRRIGAHHHLELVRVGEEHLFPQLRRGLGLVVLGFQDAHERLGE